MKHLLLLFALLLSAPVTKADTIVISGYDSTSYNIWGDYLHITSTGYLVGDVTVGAGGTVVNEGYMKSGSVTAYGGTFSYSGTFNNYGVLHVGTLSVGRWGFNFGCIKAGIVNSGPFGGLGSSGYLECDNLYVLGTWGGFLNTGVLWVKEDLRVTGGTMNNQGNTVVAQDLIIEQAGTFENNCSVIVDRNFINSGKVIGASQPGISSFNVTENTSNEGTFCSSTYCDMCDAGMPANGLDLAGGTIGPAPYVTYCDSSIQPSCDSLYVSACVPLPPDTGINPGDTAAPPPGFAAEIYPNPASSTAVFHYRLPAEKQMVITVHDAIGHEVFATRQKGEKGNNLIEINVRSLPSGIYFVTLRVGMTRQVKKLIISNREE